MQKTTKIRKVFEELRASLSGEFSDAKLLEGAKDIVEAMYDVTNDDPVFSVTEGRLGFEYTDTYSAICDAPWRVMKFESEMMGHFFEKSLDYCGHQPVLNYA